MIPDNVTAIALLGSKAYTTAPFYAPAIDKNPNQNKNIRLTEVGAASLFNPKGLR